MTLRQSLTVVVGVPELAACSAALTLNRCALEAAFAQVRELHQASLALLPAVPQAQENALFLACSFRGSLVAMLSALYALASSEIAEIFRHCEGFPEHANAEQFAAYVSARARRASAPLELPNASEPWVRARTAIAARCYLPAQAAPPDAAELERRRSAVGMQDWQPHAPLLHVASVPKQGRPRARVKRALRALEQEALPLGETARFLLHGDRLLFLTYPPQIALLWSDRVSRSALAPLTRIWSAVPGFPGQPWRRRARRARQLQRFLLDGRTPVAAWFNAAAGQRSG